MTLEARGLAVHLARRQVLKEVSLGVRFGEVVAVVGPNGAGKSTLLRVVSGLLRPLGGSVTWEGRDLLHLRARDRARIIGLVPQSAHLDHPFTVQEVVAMGRYAHSGGLGRAQQGDRVAVARALHRADLEALAERPVTELSGGERQRVLLARVLAQDPRVFLFDEPTANLDLGQAAEVQRILRSLADEGRAVVAVVHDLEAASRIADRLVLLAEGRVLAEGRPREVLTPERLEVAFGVRVETSWEEGGGVRLRVSPPGEDDGGAEKRKEGQAGAHRRAP